MTLDRSISAMVRVHNEEEFLEAAVHSILDCVAEIVLVDNASTDKTSEIIRALQSELGSLVRAYEYPYEIRRVGRETWKLAMDDPSGCSPHLSSSFYNFCLDQCTHPYVLKWDGDMIALDDFPERIDAWRASERPIMMLHGSNVHPDRRHLIAARSDDREALLRELEVPFMPAWVTSLTYDFSEPRLFPREECRYESTLLWTQRLETPYTGPGSSKSARFVAEEPSYLHMKFCKHEPLSNYSAELAEVIDSNVTIGAMLPDEHLEMLRKWGLQR